ncbi:MAG: transcriptional regulator GcvA [Rhodospirillales bacterium]
MRFRSYDTLSLFGLVARMGSFTAAAAVLNLSKGAVSYRIRRLEEELGFPVFRRGHRSLSLTEKGALLEQIAQAAFRDLDRGISALRDEDGDAITVATSTYFASRWLSPRLMTFMTAHPKIALRLQPLVDLVDFNAHGIDIALRWGKGDWTDHESELLFPCPAFPTAGADLAKTLRASPLADALPKVILLHDRDGSRAWADWYAAAGLPYEPKRDHLVIPDPNVRVQAVIDGQGLALNDALVSDDLAAGRLFRISAVALECYGYHLTYPRGGSSQPALLAFRNWIGSEAAAWMD